MLRERTMWGDGDVPIPTALAAPTFSGYPYV
jgi:hypothetical protein